MISFNNDNSANFYGEEKSTMKNSEMSFFNNTRKNFQSNLVLVVVLVLESNCPYYAIMLGLGIIVVFFVTSLETCYSFGISCTSRELTVCGTIETSKDTSSSGLQVHP